MKKSIKNTATIVAMSMFAFALLFGANANIAEAHNEAKLKMNASEKSCFRAFGHFFNKKFFHFNTNMDGSVSITGNCFFPFGIAKKFGNSDRATTTPDTITPVISDFKLESKSDSKFTFSLSTNEKTHVSVFYSSTTANATGVGMTEKVFGNLSKDHKNNIHDLSPETTYNVVIKATDKSGNTTWSSLSTVKTLPKIVLSDNKAPVISMVVASTASSSVNIMWHTNEIATSRVYFSGNSGINASSTNFVDLNGMTKIHTVKVPNLSTNTKYYFMIESKDVSGNTQKTSEFSLNTLGL